MAYTRQQPARFLITAHLILNGRGNRDVKVVISAIFRIQSIRVYLKLPLLYKFKLLCELVSIEHVPPFEQLFSSVDVTVKPTNK